MRALKFRNTAAQVSQRSGEPEDYQDRSAIATITDPVVEGWNINSSYEFTTTPY